MTYQALIHTMQKIAVPSGRALWLYGDPALARGTTYSPWYDAAHLAAMESTNYVSDIQAIGRNYDSVILNGTKQQNENEGLLALAIERSKGFVMAVAPKNAGGGRLIDMMEEYGMPFDTLSKDRCRVVWTFDAPKANRDVIATHIANLALRSVDMDGAQWWTVPGLFGWNKIDSGSKMLMQHMPKDLAGCVADFGCGFGYISTMLARHYPLIQKIDAYDIDARAIDATKRNAGEKVHAQWQDIRQLLEKPTYDAIVMNPPFHSGKKEDIALGESFIRVAWDKLKTGGSLFFVANKHLPYEKIVPNLTNLYEGEGYKIITGQKP